MKHLQKTVLMMFELVAAFWINAVEANSADKRPNFLLVVANDMGEI